MYYLKKRLEVAGAHCLAHLNYDSKCKNLHGHNWIITVYCRSESLDQNGMIIDFTKIKSIVNQLDHAIINDFVDEPTAENIAKYLCDSIPYCYKIEVQESENNLVIYEASD